MKKIFIKYKEIISYIFFGLLTTAVSWVSYIVFANAFAMSVFGANLLSWICSITFAFITNKLFVFNSKSWNLKLLLKESLSFLISRAITGIIEILGVPLLSKLGFDLLLYTVVKNIGVNGEIFYTDGIYSKLLVAVIVIILNYIFSKLFIFKNSSKKGSAFE